MKENTDRKMALKKWARHWSWIKEIRLKLSTPEKFYNFLNKKVR
jgi:hypothetical protein